MKIVPTAESAFHEHALDLLGAAPEICFAAIDEKAIRDPDPSASTLKLVEAKPRGSSRSFI